MMKFSNDTRLPVILQAILFIIPVNIYVIGDWLASGIQWSLFRYQQSDLGNSLIWFTKDISYLQQNLLKGRSVLAAECDIIATLLMILAFFILVFALTDKPGIRIKYGALCSLVGGVCFLIADIIQYGILFNGSSGFIIPVGIPVIFIAGIWMYRTNFQSINLEKPDKPKIS